MVIQTKQPLCMCMCVFVIDGQCCRAVEQRSVPINILHVPIRELSCCPALREGSFSPVLSRKHCIPDGNSYMGITESKAVIREITNHLKDLVFISLNQLSPPQLMAPLIPLCASS